MPLQILVVDDSPAMCRLIEKVVRASGLPVGTVLHAGDGLQALDRLRQSAFDLVLSDINMPVMDGRELLVRIMSDANLQKVPVVVISTDASTERMRQMIAEGAMGYIQKPFRPADLQEELRRVVRVSVELSNRTAVAD